jgi:hypothetical protein
MVEIKKTPQPLKKLQKIMSETAKTTTPCLPWSVKGVSTAARQAAKDAAMQSQQTMGAWLSAAIRQAAADNELLASLLADAPATKTAPAANSIGNESMVLGYLQKMDAKLNDMGERLQHLEQADTELPALPPIAMGLGKFGPQS